MFTTSPTILVGRAVLAAALTTLALAPIAAAQPAGGGIGGDPWPNVGSILAPGRLDWNGVHGTVSANKYTLAADSGTGGGYIRIQYTSRATGYDDSFPVRAGSQVGGQLLARAAAFTVCDGANKVCAPGWTPAA